ncbi:MAG: penicillin acylase family protein, partial [Actinomadura sp.]
FPYGGSGGIDPDRPGVALPDLDGPTAPGSGATVAGKLPALDDLLGKGELPALPGRLDTPFGTVDLRQSGSGMSNAALVAADRTRSGHPVAVFGPQTGYYAPQLLTEQVLDGPGVKARGVAFAGTNLVVQLGRGVDYAWSATSASGDNVDTVAERLCNVDGSPATVNSTAYVRKGVCTPLDSRTHTETVIPNLTAPTLPKQLKFQVLRTDHGIVQLRTTAAGGTPVAIVLQRSTYQHEVDSIMGFSRVNDPGVVRDAASFQRAVDGIDYTFNWFYADSRDIAYYGSGLLPKRSADVEFDLPRWGDARFDWQGFLPFEDHARQVNPPTGYLVSWNNKQAPGFSAADNIWGYGPVYRSLALSDRIEAARDVTRESLAGLVEDAATVDSRARHTLPMLLDTVGDGGSDPQVASAVTALGAWLADGAHRVDRDRDGAYDHQAAIALFDAWWETAAESTLRGGLGPLVDALPQGLDNHPRSGTGSAWNGVAWYGYVSKDLRQLLGQPVTGRWHRSYCGDGSLATCRQDLRGSLAVAAAGLLQEQGATSVSALTYDKHIDDIRATVGGVVGVRPIDWQNRPTFQQVVAYTAHRP